MYRTALLCVAALALIVLPVVAQERRQVRIVEVEVKGTVVDAAGTPVAGILVAEFWVYDGTWKPRGENAATTDKEGRFAASVRTLPDLPTRNHRIQAVDADSTRAAVMFVSRESLGEEVKLVLQPLVSVSAKLVPPEGVELDGPVHVGASLAGERMPLLNMASSAAEGVSLRLPPGKYAMRVSAGRNFKPVAQEFTVEAGKEKQELSPIQLKLTELAKLAGKEAPDITISHIRNLPADLADKGTEIKLKDFRGRWVMLEFWGWW